MKINKILAAFGNIDKIAEGIKNKIFKNEDVEHISALRMQECRICPFYDTTGSSCAVPGTTPCCADCGCSLGLKTRSLAAECPKGRWEAVVNPEQAEQIKKQIIMERKAEHDRKIEAWKKRKKQKENDSNI